MKIKLRRCVKFNSTPNDSAGLYKPGDPCGFVSTTEESVIITTKPITTNPINIPTTVVTLNNTNPIWYYYSQIGPCQAGMVGIINPP